MTTDTISSDDAPQTWPVPPGPRREPAGAGARATALATAALLVAAGGVATAAVRSSSGPTAADDLVPSSAFAFAQLDLDPGSAQTSALKAFLDHFPGSPTRSSGSLRDALLGAMMKDSSDPHVDYTKDVKPWLGDRAAVAGWIDAGGRPQVEYLLRSTNDAAARSSLHRLAPKAGLDFRGGYAVLASTQSSADAALAASSKHSLAKDTTYRHDIAALPGTQIVVGWADAHGVVRALRTLPQFQHFLALPGAASLGLAELQSTTGRIVAGAHAADRYVELDVRQTGSKSPTSGKPASSALLTGLPSGTLAAAELADPASIVGRIVSAVRMFAPATTSPLQQSADPLVAIQRATGLALPGDAARLFGPALVVSYGGLSGGLPNVALRSRPANLADAQTLAGRVSAAIRAHGGPALAVTGAGGDLVVATTQAYADTVSHESGLGSDDRFRTAMGSVPSQVSFAAYVDLADIIPLFVHGDQVATHFDSVGLWAAREGDTNVLQVRLVAR